MSNISHLIDRLGTLAAQSASGGTTDSSRVTLNSEFSDILSEITREAAVANLSNNAGFSVFVSNNGTNGTVSGTISAVTNTALTLNGHTITSQA